MKKEPFDFRITNFEKTLLQFTDFLDKKMT